MIGAASVLDAARDTFRNALKLGFLLDRAASGFGTTALFVRKPLVDIFGSSVLPESTDVKLLCNA